MTITIPAVQDQNIIHGLLIDLAINDQLYYFNTGVNNITYQTRAYIPLGGFLAISDIQNTLQNAADELNISLSGIPENYVAAVVGEPIKGGVINIYRYFKDSQGQIVDNRIYARFKGIITNFSISEDLDRTDNGVDINYVINLTCSSIFGVLENRISGRRTNEPDYKIPYQRMISGVKTNERFITSNIANDPSFNRVVALFDEKFDFGMPYKPQGQSTVQNQFESSNPDPNDIRDAG